MCTTNEEKVLQIQQPPPSASPSNLAPQGTESYSYLNPLSPGNPSPEAQQLYKQYTSKSRFKPRELREELSELDMPFCQKNIDNDKTPQPKDTPGSPDDGLCFCLPAIAHEMKSTDSEAMHNEGLAIIENTLVRASNELDLINVQREYAEPVYKEPIFETFVNTSHLGSNWLLYSWQHSFLGLRFTYYDSAKQEYVRMHFRIGMGAGEDISNVFTLTFNARVMNDIDTSFKIATHTPLENENIPDIIQNIISYLASNKYQILTRNCNTFVKAMAQQMGINDIAYLHNSISPVTVANNVLNSLTKANDSESVQKYSVTFDGDRDDEKTAEEGGPRGPLDFKNGKLALPISADDFEKEAREAGKKDLNLFERIYKVDFKAKETEEGISGIKNEITEIEELLNNFNNGTCDIDTFREEMSVKCTETEEALRSLVVKTKSSHTYLKIYLMGTADLLSKVRLNLNDNCLYKWINSDQFSEGTEKSNNLKALYEKFVGGVSENINNKSDIYKNLRVEGQLIFYSLFPNYSDFKMYANNENLKTISISNFLNFTEEEAKGKDSEIFTYLQGVFRGCMLQLKNNQKKDRLVSLMRLARNKRSISPNDLSKEFAAELTKTIGIWVGEYMGKDNYCTKLINRLHIADNLQTHIPSGIINLHTKYCNEVKRLEDQLSSKMIDLYNKGSTQ